MTYRTSKLRVVELSQMTRIKYAIFIIHLSCMHLQYYSFGNASVVLVLIMHV